MDIKEIKINGISYRINCSEEDCEMLSNSKKPLYLVIAEATKGEKTHHIIRRCETKEQAEFVRYMANVNVPEIFTYSIITLI